MHVAAYVRARRRTFVERAVFVPEGGDLGEAHADDGTFSRSQLVKGINFSRRDILDEILDRCRVLHEVVTDRLWCLAGWRREVPANGCCH